MWRIFSRKSFTGTKILLHRQRNLLALLFEEPQCFIVTLWPLTGLLGLEIHIYSTISSYERTWKSEFRKSLIASNIFFSRK